MESIAENPRRHAEPQEMCKQGNGQTHGFAWCAPHQRVKALDPLTPEQYEQNLLHHGIIR